MSDVVRLEVVDGVAVVSLNRPEKHNAFNDELYTAWREAMEWAAGSDTVRAVLLRGEGRSFSSGRDTSELGQRAGGESDFAFVRHHQEARLHDLGIPKPVVAALKGAVIGGAFEVALAADIRIASTDIKMGFPEIRYGLLPDTGGTAFATILAGPSRAKLLVMSGELIDAQQALTWGLVDRVVEPADLDDAALTLARRLAAGPPLALAMAKQLIDDVWSATVRSGLRSELLAQSALFASEDYEEARAALREGRAPDYRGR
jgi:enoyl-CoA hydratase/carnithine racemase